MSNQLVIPRHLQVLAAAWSEHARWLESAIEAVLPTVADCVDPAHHRRLAELAGSELDALKAWGERLGAWFSGPMAAALATPEISDAEMRRVADRIVHFASELIDHRVVLRALAIDPAMRAAAPRLDAVYVSLLRQVQGFIARIAQALEPEALLHASERRPGQRVELSFAFVPSIEPEMSWFLAWVDRVRAARPNEIKPSGRHAGARDSVPAKSPERPGSRGYFYLNLVLFAAIVTWGFNAVLIALALWAVVLAFRYPLLTLLLLLFGLS